jgi:hypothetical protein
MAGQHSAPTDFDFFIGSWEVRHRRLRERLASCDEWDDFSGTAVVRKILGGFGNMDDNVLDLPGGSYRAVTLRSFDRDKRQWAIWWLDGRNPWTLDTPVVGSFTDGVGAFYTDDTLNGRAIRVRYLWTVPRRDAPHWEQAFSADAGATWETNWTMDFSRYA